MIAGRSTLLAAAAWIALAPCRAPAHGFVTVPVSGGEGVRVAYDDDEPVSFADVQVYAPGGGKPVLTGVTDRNGCFLFRPDTAGVWKVSIDDGMGHAAPHFVTSGVAASAATSAPPPARMSKAQGVVTGLSMIFGVFGWAAWLRLRTRRG